MCEFAIIVYKKFKKLGLLVYENRVFIEMKADRERKEWSSETKEASLFSQLIQNRRFGGSGCELAMSSWSGFPLLIYRNIGLTKRYLKILIGGKNKKKLIKVYSCSNRTT